MQSIDPTTGTALSTYAPLDGAQARDRARAAAEAQRAWSLTPIEARTAALRQVAEALRGEAPEHARRMALEMGKPLTEGLAEVEKCAWVCEHYAEHAAADLADDPVEAGVSKSLVTYRPLGVVLAIMPWNFPLWQVFRFAAPALAAGNAVLLKHAPNVQGCAQAIAAAWERTDLPADLFQNLALAEADVADLIASRDVAAVTLTGSTRAGRAVAAAAGAHLKPVVLELGGSDPYVVLADADLASAAEQCAFARLLNSGQSCIAAKRFLVVDAAYDAFRAALLPLLREAVVGNPLDPETTIGPLAREDLRATLHAQVRASVDAGAACTLGGTLPDGPGWFYPVTLLEDVGPGMPAYDQELFGPVATLIRAADEADALRIANDTSYGLGAAVFTADAARGERIAREELEAGCAFVNGFVRSDPRLPFGGIKDSGMGRELGRAGIRAFVNVKTIWIA